MHDRIHLLEALARAQALFVEEEEPQSLFGRLLDILLEFTGSEYGFIGEVFRDPDGAPYLRTHAITDVSWDEGSRKLYEESTARGMEFRNLDTLFGAVLRTEEPVISADPSRDPRSGGLPPGHPPLRSFLGLPFKRNEEVLGMVGLANRPEGYPEEAPSLLDPLLRSCGSLVAAERRRRADRGQLDERDSMLQAILDTLLNGLVTIDERGTILSVNPATERIFGYRREELVGRNVAMLAAEPHGSMHDEYLRRYLETGIPRVIGFNRIVEGRRKDGSTFPVSLGVGEFRGASGRMFVGTLRDLTVERRTEVRLRRTEERLQAVLDAASEVSIIATDPEGVITVFNRGAERMLGYRAEEMIGRETPARFHLAEEVADRGRELTAEVGRPVEGFEVFVLRARQGVAEKREWTYVRKDGTRLAVEMVVTAVTGEGAGDTAFLGVAVDVTERREVERMKDEFVSVVSHELRTPLTSIRGSLGLVASGALGAIPPKGQRMLEIAVNNTDRLVRLINDILDIERMESGQAPMERRPCDLGDLMLQAAEVMGPMAEKEGVQLRSTPLQVQIHADPDRILQVLTNLLSNAIKFSPPGGTVLLDGNVENSEARLRVADEGRGIPHDKLETIFERFHQVDASDARDKGGTGLGLPICRTIAEQHGGRIWAESVPGQGSTFVVVLPLLQATRTEAPTPLVLLASEARPERRALVEGLEERGYRVALAASGTEVLKLVEGQSPDTVLLDLALPGLDAADILARLSGGLRSEPVPVVFFSSRAEGADLVPGSEVLHGLDQEAIAAAVRRALAGGAERPRVVVAEDDEDLLSILAIALEEHGIECHPARTGREAISRIQEANPHLVILDLVLPEGDGFSVAGWLRRQSRFRSLPLVVYSASDLNRVARERLQGGETHVYTKGRIAPEQFTGQILELLGRISSGERSEDA